METKKAYNPNATANYLAEHADRLAKDAEKIWLVKGGGAVTMFYTATTETDTGTMTMVHVDDDPPFGSTNSGITVRGNIERQQIARLLNDRMRRLPILPLEL